MEPPIRPKKGAQELECEVILAKIAGIITEKGYIENPNYSAETIAKAIYLRYCNAGSSEYDSGLYNHLKELSLFSSVHEGALREVVQGILRPSVVAAT